MQFVDNIKGGIIPKNLFPPSKKGLSRPCINGPLAGYPMDSMKVRLFDGSFHDVDSDSLSFELLLKLVTEHLEKSESSAVRANDGS